MASAQNWGGALAAVFDILAVIADNHLDVRVMKKTWIPSDAPNAIINNK